MSEMGRPTILVVFLVTCAYALGHYLAAPDRTDLPVNCAWNPTNVDPRCTSKAYSWDGKYPKCSLFQYPNRTEIPCQGNVQTDFCTAEDTPQPASHHIHVFYPKPGCKQCHPDFMTERENFTYAGAKQVRHDIARALNDFTQEITGTAADIDLVRALEDPTYNSCRQLYGIGPGTVGKFMNESCAFRMSEGEAKGPFLDPKDGLNYPDFAFFVPGDYWVPGLMSRMREFLKGMSYDVLIHPNTGCNVRDHTDHDSAEWLSKAYPLNTIVFGDDPALGKNPACARYPNAPPPAKCP